MIGRHRRTLVLVGAAGIVALAIAGTVLAQTPARGGLSRTEAIRLARSHADSGVTDVRSAEIRHNYDTGLGLPVHPWAWVVTFNGHWQLICTGACDRTSEWVAIDYDTGAWIASEYSYPASTH